jgi:hypothetical protein
MYLRRYRAFGSWTLLYLDGELEPGLYEIEVAGIRLLAWLRETRVVYRWGRERRARQVAAVDCRRSRAACVALRRLPLPLPASATPVTRARRVTRLDVRKLLGLR